MKILNEPLESPNSTAETEYLRPIEIETTKEDLKQLRKLRTDDIKRRLSDPDYYKDEDEYPVQKVQQTQPIKDNKLKTALGCLGIVAVGTITSFAIKDLAPMTLAAGTSYFIAKNQGLTIEELLKSLPDEEDKND